jgi:Ca2+-binding RTX toxin-like protein
LIANIANVRGGNAAGVLTGNGEANVLTNAAGDDLFIATVNDASDLFDGGLDFDTLDRTAYATDLSVDLAPGTATILGTGSSEALSDRARGIEAINFGSGADRVFGNGSANRFSTGAGADTLSGGSGNDTLDGGDGDDVLIGGAGVDMLTGGLGAECFVFALVAHSTVAGSDIILDFEEAGDPGGDLIDISDVAGLPFIFIGSEAFARGSTNRVRLFDNGTDTFVQLDTDKDATAEAQIRILGLHDPGVADFIL